LPSADLLKEAERVMVVCNACRYCEGYCAVFPAMERRRTFSNQDLIYLSHLCHDCRGCYYACQYAPPHEFALNVPKTFAELSLATYRDFSWPGFLKGVFRRNGWTVSLVTLLGVAMVLFLVINFQDPALIFTTHLGPDAFYKVIPYELIVLPVLTIGLFTITALLVGISNFWRDTGGRPGMLFHPRTNFHALKDALMLRYLDGGGYGCNYPDDRFSMARRWFHHFVFYGFLLCFTATTVAAIYHHFLHWKAPYPLWSLPVMLGAIGGSAMLVGTGGLFYLRGRMDREPATPRSTGMDVSFLVLLFLTNLTGMSLLLFRQTPAMGTLLAVHIGMVVGLFITMPYGKFLHALYRYASLVRNAAEKSGEERHFYPPSQNTTGMPVDECANGE
jgi:citrate/tricarballylate utilization protein